MEVLIPNAIINSDMSHNKFILINNVLKKYMKKKILKIPMVNKYDWWQYVFNRWLLFR